MQEEVKFPFFSDREAPDDSSFAKSIQTRFLPHMKLASLTTALVAANIIIFVVMHIAYRPSSYGSFLAWPTQMDKWLLDIELVKADKAHMYQVVTAMFMHDSYLHIVGNSFFALFVMYEIEHSWKWSILLGLAAGVAANCLAVLSTEGRFLGFSGVLTSYVGMIALVLLAHLSYFESRSRGAYCWIMIVVLMLSLSVVSSGKGVLVHLYGLLFGALLAAGFQPKHAESSIGPACQKIFKFASVGAIVLVIVLAFVLK